VPWQCAIEGLFRDLVCGGNMMSWQMIGSQALLRLITTLSNGMMSRVGERTTSLQLAGKPKLLSFISEANEEQCK
jgi:hypothetical protein